MKFEKFFLEFYLLGFCAFKNLNFSGLSYKVVLVNKKKCFIKQHIYIDDGR